MNCSLTARMKIAIGADDVGFTLTERTRREAHLPTPEELADNEKREERRQRAQRRQDWDATFAIGYGNTWPEFDTVYTGQLVFAIDGWSDGLRKTWADGKTQTVEGMLDAIVDGIRVVIASNKARREENEERQRKWHDLTRRRDLAARRKKREEHRIVHLRQLVEFQREARDIREWMASLPKDARPEPTSELGRMLIWAGARLADLDARTTVQAAATLIDGKALFPEADDLKDPLGDPPESPGYW